MKPAKRPRKKSKGKRGVGRSVAVVGLAVAVSAAGAYGAYTYWPRSPAIVATAPPEKPAIVAKASTPELKPPANIPAPTQATRSTVAKPRVAAATTKMSPDNWRDLDQTLARAVRGCWTWPDADNSTDYAPKLKIEFSPDGSMARAPVLLNPGDNPAAKAIAESATKAMARCSKFSVPARFQAYYDEWKVRVIHFDAAG